MPERLLILGGGFAATSLLKKLDMRRYDVSVVSKRNHFLFTPLLPSTTVGTIEFRSIIEPIRRVRRGIRFAQGSAKSLDVAGRRVSCREDESGAEFALEYDVLVISVGAWTSTFGVPGVNEHALFLKELIDARKIRERILACLERAAVPGTPLDPIERLLHFIVVGGGATGIEFAAELHDLLVENVANSYPQFVAQFRVTVLEAMSHVLSGFDHSLAEYTTRSFRGRGIDLRLEAPVAQVLENGVRLEGGETIHAGTVVWTSGVGPSAFVRGLELEKDRSGRLSVDEYLRVVGHEKIYAAGDCAAIVGNRLPLTAQVAMQQGKYLGKSLNRLARGKAMKPFHFNNLGMLAYVGDQRALAEVPKANLRWRGMGAYLFWRSAYLTRLVSFKNKVLVLFDWLKTSVFGRDLSRF